MKLQAGDFIHGGGVYLPNKKQPETVAALTAMIEGKLISLKYVWNGSFLLFVAVQPDPMVAGKSFKWGGELQKIGRRLVYLSGGPSWRGTQTSVTLISFVESNKRAVEVK
jgi:hypothetical protein